MSDEQVPAGWYPDPAGDATRIRYWDGSSWTENTQPFVQSAFSTDAEALPVTRQPVNSPEQMSSANAGQPFMTQPYAGQSGSGQPYLAQPVVGQPTMAQPVIAYPYAGQPGIRQPGMGQPGMGQPGMGQPGMGQPVLGRQPTDRKGFATAGFALALSLWVLSIVMFLVPVLAFVYVFFGPVLGILTIVFSALGMRSTKKGFAIAGLILGILAFIAFIIIIIIALMIAADPLSFGLPSDYFNDILGS